MDSTNIHIEANTAKVESNQQCDNLICENMDNHSYVRKRTRATAEQLAVLEDTFSVNVSPNSKLRKQLSEQLKMSERSIQIWFQNRRAKIKHIQKRAQMQMQQAAIRAQLYHYHQQQQQYTQSPFGAPPMISMQPNLFQQPPQVQVPPPQQPYFYPAPYFRRMPLPRAQSVDAISYYNPSDMMARPGYPATGPEPYAPTNMTMPPVSSTSWSAPPPPPVGLENDLGDANHMALSRQSMPPYSNHPLSHSFADDAASDFSHPNSAKQILSEDLSGFVHNQMSPSPCPNESDSNGFNYYTTSPTIGLGKEGELDNNEENLISTEPPTGTPEQDLWPSLNTNTAESPRDDKEDPLTVNTCTENTTMVATINPSNIMMPKFGDDTCHFNISALTVGTWHRVKLHSSDLVCNYNKDLKTFVWYITEGGCRFKIEVPLSTVTSIEYVPENESAQVQIYMTQPPLFYMESKDEWMQCSDFTENKQASRYMRHVLKGASETLKQDLMLLLSQNKELENKVQFLNQETTPFLPSQQQTTCHPPYSWQAPNMMPEQFVTCGFYS